LESPSGFWGEDTLRELLPLFVILNGVNMRS